jgi:CBS domain-containing protein
MLRSVNLRDYMLTHPATIDGDAPLTEAMSLIIDNRISGLCVIDGQHNLIGILSELDCLRAVLGAVYNKSSIGAVRDYMATENLTVAHPDEDIVDVAQDMLMNHRRRRPVVEDGRLVGQITCRQLLKAVREFQGDG